MAGSSNIFRRCSIFKSEDSFCYHFTSVWSNNPGTENSISCFISDNFNHSFCVIIASCSTISHKWESTNFIFDSFSFQLFFRFSNISNFWMSIYDTWNSIVVYVTTFSKHLFNSSDTFFLRFMSKHWSLNDVTNSINIWNSSLPVFVDWNLSSFVSFKSSILKCKACSIWFSSNR